MPRPVYRPRWEDAALDDAALAVARRTRTVLVALEAAGDTRWRAWFEVLVPVFEDGDRSALEAAGRKARAAFGAKDSVRDVVDSPDLLVLRDAIDVLLRVLAERAARPRPD